MTARYNVLTSWYFRRDPPLDTFRDTFRDPGNTVL